MCCDHFRAHRTARIAGFVCRRPRAMSAPYAQHRDEEYDRGCCRTLQCAYVYSGPGPACLHPILPGREILTTRSALEGERKQVIVLFADLKSPTELSRDLDPEAAQQ